MPPDSSIPPDPQARPCATLALRPGWLASDLGIGARTGLHAELTAYSIVFWGHDALPAQDMVAWQQEKARLMAEMSLAGQKGAYGKLGALSSGLNRAFDNHIELSLRAGAGTHVRTEEALALANGLAEETSCRVLAWSVCRNHVHVIAELTEEKGVDELVCSWKALAPSMNWEDAYHTEALKAREAAARVDALISELGDDAVAAVDAEADGAVSGTGFRHITVLLHETVDMLKAGPGKFIVDCTLGGGGHTELLLEQGATVWGIDRDADARRAAMLRLARFGSRFKALAGNFQDVESILSQQGVSRVDGLLADLGVSSHQLDTAARGFSFREDGPLDMRMDTRAAFSARNLVNEAPEEEIANIIWQFGEERASRAIARAIGKARAQAPITTTAQLARIVESPRHPHVPGSENSRQRRAGCPGRPAGFLRAPAWAGGPHGRHHLPQPGRPQGQAVLRAAEPSGNRPPGMAGSPPQPGLLFPPAFPQARYCGRRRTFNQPPFPQRQVARRGKNHLTISLSPPP